MAPQAGWSGASVLGLCVLSVALGALLTLAVIQRGRRGAVWGVKLQEDPVKPAAGGAQGEL